MSSQSDNIAQYVNRDDLVDLIKTVRAQTISEGLSKWSIVLVASISVICSICTFVVYDTVATPRILRYESGQYIVDSLRDIHKTEKRLLQEELNLIQRLKVIEEKLDAMEADLDKPRR